ncbi:MAG TPA: protease inhibitor I42 family protein [Desulfuromonadaceae bacterium]
MKKQGSLLTTLFLALLLTFAVQAETAGAAVSVVLDENPTTGYEWRYVASPEGILKEVSDEYTQDAGAEGLTGAGGKHIWTFEGAAEGGTVLHFAYARPFEVGVAPVRVVSFVYTVDEGLNAFQWGSAEASGGYVFISLAENPTTGYQWVLEPGAEGVLSQESDEYMPDESPEGPVGAGGTRAWRFAAAAAGEVTLRFSLERSFEPGVANELRFTFTVDEGLNVTLKMVE